MSAEPSDYERGVTIALDSLENQVAFWLANRYHSMPSIQKQIDRENEVIEDGIASCLASVRRRLAPAPTPKEPTP